MLSELPASGPGSAACTQANTDATAKVRSMAIVLDRALCLPLEQRSVTQCRLRRMLRPHLALLEAWIHTEIQQETLLQHSARRHARSVILVSAIRGELFVSFKEPQRPGP